ncbi:TetR/AcrR family transcriptional regulator [Peribacillus asahii]|uniref:TetR/AcrR family transcriptional regulator n=1 Tax=Peribacillus asahii TaxID=228899 RepID=UPI00207A52D1|nr:TetR/AcrR family transcriptional regulator [Peribacillus asahii]USK68898.1 TetR/AcrR family transcriptional regulator [Peribacillus asahii]
MNNKAEKRREQILRAAFQAVSEKGFHSVTLQDIADYADVSKGVTSYYFQNKEDVFRHLLEWVTEKIYKNEHAAISKEHNALDKLRAYVYAAFANPSDNRKFYRVYLEFLAQANHNEQFRQTNDQFYENCWSIGREIIQLGQKEGTFANVDIDKASYTIRALIDGSLIQWLMQNNDQLHTFYRDNCLETLSNYLTNKNNQNSNQLSFTSEEEKGTTI